MLYLQKFVIEASNPVLQKPVVTVYVALRGKDQSLAPILKNTARATW
jgi:hypothetical protein